MSTTSSNSGTSGDSENVFEDELPVVDGGRSSLQPSSSTRLTESGLVKFRNPPKNVVASLLESEIASIDPRLYEDETTFCTRCNIGCSLVLSSLSYVYVSKKLHRVFCFHGVVLVVGVLLMTIGGSIGSNFEMQNRFAWRDDGNGSRYLSMPVAQYASFWGLMGIGYAVLAVGIVVARIEERVFFYLHRELALRTLEAMTDPHYVPRPPIMCGFWKELCCVEGCCPKPPPVYGSFHARCCWGGCLEGLLLLLLLILTVWCPPLCIFIVILFCGICAVKPVSLMNSKGWWGNHDLLRKETGIVLGIGLGAFLLSLIPFFYFFASYVAEVAAMRAFFHLLKVSFDKNGDFEIADGEFSNTLQSQDSAQLEDWDQLSVNADAPENESHLEL